MKIGFALCGSFCTFAQVFPVMEQMAQNHTLIPILSQATQTVNSRFGTVDAHWARIRNICKSEPICSILEAEPIGPQKLLDALIVAPCTGNTLSKLAHSVADGPVTMAVKSHLRNARPVIIAISTNDALAGAAENIGRLLNKRNYYFVPFRQDDPYRKPTSIVADFAQIPETLEKALSGMQLQPLLLQSNQ